MSSPGSPILDLDVGSRRMEKRVAGLAICVAAGAPWLMATGWAALLVTILASASCWLGFRRAGWLEGERRLSRVSWSAEGEWMLSDARGRQWAAVLRSDSRVTSGLVWLRWHTQEMVGGSVQGGKQGGTHSMLLTLGDIQRSQLRRLCVRLRLSGRNSAESDVIGQLRTPAI